MGEWANLGQQQTLGGPTMKLEPCRYLDYTEGKYAACIIENCAPQYPKVRFWRRGEVWLDNGPGQPRNPEKVQFCGAGRGRINGIFDCYQPGSMSCYEPVSEAE